jgi:8-oxo-dGTP pyrophosphatase MutT (NUDIX family)
LHHGKLNRWLQPGGHGEGEIDPCAIALREVREETGLAESELTALFPRGAPSNQAALFDVDIHTIPARKTEAEHLHLDLRFAWIAREGSTPRLSEESRALDWFPLEKPPVDADAALLRAFKKLAAAR